MRIPTVAIGGGIVAVLVIGAAIYFVTIGGDSDSSVTTTQVSTGEQADIGNTKEACEVFTLEIAKTVMGENAAKGELPPGAQASTDDVSVTNCLYQTEGSSMQFATASVLVRGAKTSSGKSSNVFGFEGNQDRSNFEEISTEFGPTEALSGIGDKAFYDPDFEQVNVLVGDGKYWLIIQTDNRAQSEQLAKLLVANL